MGNRFPYFFSSIGLFVIAVVLIYLRAAKPNITTTKDLRFINGKLTEHHYYNGGMRGASSCWFRLDNYSNSFAVDGKNLDKFNIGGFLQLTNGDSVKVGMSQTDFSRLNLDEGDIFIFALRNNQNILLSGTDAIRNYQTHFSYYLASLFLLSSFVIFYVALSSRRKLRHNKS